MIGIGKVWNSFFRLDQNNYGGLNEGTVGRRLAHGNMGFGLGPVILSYGMQKDVHKFYYRIIVEWFSNKLHKL